MQKTTLDEEILIFVYEQGEVRYMDLYNEFVVAKRCAKQTFINHKKGLEASGRLDKKLSEKTRSPVYFIPKEKWNEVEIIKARRGDDIFFHETDVHFSRNIFSDIDFSKMNLTHSVDSRLKQSGVNDFPAPIHATIYAGKETSEPLIFMQGLLIQHGLEEEKAKEKVVFDFLNDAINSIFPYFFWQHIDYFCRETIKKPLTLENMLDFSIGLKLRFDGKKNLSVLSNEERKQLKHRIIAYLLLRLIHTQFSFVSLETLIPLMVKARFLDKDEGEELKSIEGKPLDSKERKYLLQKISWNHLIKAGLVKNLPKKYEDFDKFREKEKPKIIDVF